MRDFFWARWGWHLNVIAIFCGLWISIYATWIVNDVMLHGRPGGDVAFWTITYARGWITMGLFFAMFLGLVLILRLVVRFLKDVTFSGIESELQMLDRIGLLENDPGRSADLALALSAFEAAVTRYPDKGISLLDEVHVIKRSHEPRGPETA